MNCYYLFKANLAGLMQQSLGEGHLKKCPAMGKKCKNCSKPNHFAKICRSQQVNEIAEKTSSSDEERILIQSFDSSDEFEIMATESETSSMEQIDEYIKQQPKRKLNIGERHTKG